MKKLLLLAGVAFALAYTPASAAPFGCNPTWVGNKLIKNGKCNLSIQHGNEKAKASRPSWSATHPTPAPGPGPGPGPGDDDDGNNGHGNDDDHDDDSNPGQGNGNHGTGNNGNGNGNS